MQLTEKYRPRTKDDFVDNHKALEEMEDYIESNFPIILLGPPGCGKTSAVLMLAESKQYFVQETNASDERKKIDLKELSSRLQSNSFHKTIYLLDEVDGMKNQTFLAQILKKSKKPVVMTANNKQALSKELLKTCKLIEFKKPVLANVVKRIKYIAEKEKLKPDYTKITTDIRASINDAFNYGDTYKEDKNEFDKVSDIFKGHKLHDINPFWLIDNVTNYYHGKDIIDALETIKVYEIVKKKEVLSCLPTSSYGRAKYPNYFRRRKNGYT